MPTSVRVVSGPPTARAVVGALSTGLAGGTATALAEIAAFGSPRSPHLVGVVLALCLALGAAVGAALAVAEAAVALLRLRGAGAALLRAAPCLLALVPVGRHLFDGGFAGTLPCAALAPVWFPALGALGVAGLLWAGDRLLRAGPQQPGAPPPAPPAPARRRAALGLALGAAAAALDLANRRLYASEYPDVHALLTLCCCVCAGLALRLLAGASGLLPRAPALRPWALLAAGAALLACGGLVALRLRGIERRDVRWAIATRGMHARQLARVAGLRGPGAGPAGAAPAAEVLPEVLPPGTRTPAEIDAHARLRARPDVHALLDRTRRCDVVLVSIDALRADALEGPEARRRYRATYGVVPREVLRWGGEALITRGLGRFDVVLNDPLERDLGSSPTSDATTDLGLAFLDGHARERPGSPALLWLHYFDVHEHDELEPDAGFLRAETAERSPPTRAQQYALALDAVDRAVGRLVDGLARRGRWETSVVVLLGDHGESLGEDPRASCTTPSCACRSRSASPASPPRSSTPPRASWTSCPRCSPWPARTRSAPRARPRSTGWTCSYTSSTAPRRPSWTRRGRSS